MVQFIRYSYALQIVSNIIYLYISMSFFVFKFFRMIVAFVACLHHVLIQLLGLSQ